MVCWYALGGWVVGHGAVVQWSDLVVGVMGHSGATSLIYGSMV